MATSGRQQPAWEAPQPASPDVKIPPLKIFNSLTRSKTAFVPIDPKGRKVSWYACGPTVYDDAHLGHARNYVSTDIIRRIMKDYFKFDVKFVMNITDVDDKIIVRGRQQHLLAQFMAAHTTLDDAEILETTTAAYRAYAKKNLPRLPEDLQPEQYELLAGQEYGSILKGGTLSGEGTPGDKEAKVKMHLKTMTSASNALASLKKGALDDLAEYYSQTQDVLLPYLDSLYGSSINANDHSIFTKLTQKYEKRFMEDVRALNCLDPDEVTRVTEYGQQIVTFVEKIVKNGFGYATSDGSVYFDIGAFEAAGNPYARLEPWNRNDKELQADGEGALTKKSTEKRNDADFALWKSSKPGEPSWDSPWGRGRPGWHIECSAMASDTLGGHIDIHSGGIDLAFPHHDNELAQSEAFWLENSKEHECGHQHQWVNYFLHMGHLSIQGSKMSKSLKNFTTIREALSRGEWTPRSLRIVFLLGGWKEGVEITEDMVTTGNAWEGKVNNFFINAKSLLDEEKSSSKQSGGLVEALESAKSSLYSALCDSFNTPAAMLIISDLISTFNSTDKEQLDHTVIKDTAKWITEMVNVFGLMESSPEEDQIGWSGTDVPAVAKPYVYPLSGLRDELRRRAIAGEALSSEELVGLCVSSEASTDANGVDTVAKPFANALSTFRSSVRSIADTGSPSNKDILALCDRVRDIDLWDLGIYLEDREAPRPALVRPVNKELVAAREERAERERQKKAAKEAREKEAQAKLDKGKLSHLDLFRTNEYSAWDEEGMPLKDAKGEELPKSRVKKLRKDWERQKKAHEAWLASKSSVEKVD